MKTNLSTEQIERVQTIFADRARFDKIERLVYSHDMGVVPDQVRSLIDHTPDGIVQPKTVDEVIGLAKFCHAEKIPMVPRGAGSAAYGGSVPAKAGIVVDFTRMNKVLSIDLANKMAVVEPGVIWMNLENALNAQEMTLRAYPSSAKSSTVGGWVAQGGNGYGSYEYGDSRQNIVAVTVVLPNGNMETFKGEELDKVYRLCGITGMIVQVTVKVRAKEEECVVLGAFSKLEKASEFMNTLSSKGIQVWNVSLATPAFTQLQQKASGKHVLPEDAYVVTTVFPKSRKPVVEKQVTQLVNACAGKVMSEKLAKEEWADRFYPMRFKKLGPSLVASEVVIPISQIANFVADIEKKYKGEFALEGTMAGNDKISILGFMLADERKLGFPMAYACALEVIDAGEKFGGRVYSLGMYFPDRIQTIFDDRRLSDIWNFKQSVDPSGIMNPGKVIPPSMDKGSPTSKLVAAMKVGNFGSSVIGFAGRLLSKAQSGDFTSPLDDHITDDTFSCAQCGYCRNVCTVFDPIPWESNSPRGKYYLLNQYIKGKIPMDEELGRALFPCTTCKKCENVCQIQAKNADHWVSLRQVFIKNGLHNTGLEFIRNNVKNTGNFWGMGPEERMKWLDVPTETVGKVAVWSGCWGQTIQDAVSQNITRILNRLEIPFVHFKEREQCCGFYMGLGGYKEDFQTIVKRNLEMFKEAGVETIITGCPACVAAFRDDYPKLAKEMGFEYNVTFKHIAEYLSDLVASGELKFPVPVEATATLHDSCHAGRWFGIYDEPRNVIKAIPGIEFEEMKSIRENSLCCGLVSAFDSLPSVVANGDKRVQEAVDIGVDYLVTACGGCGSQLNATCQRMGTKVKQIDLTTLAAQGLGIPTVDNSGQVGAYMGQAVELLKDSTLAPFAVPAEAKK
jgi:Fe-S oxidoreductase/FAD/FMN-containing dehydrogenase